AGRRPPRPAPRAHPRPDPPRASGAPLALLRPRPRPDRPRARRRRPGGRDDPRRQRLWLRRGGPDRRGHGRRAPRTGERSMRGRVASPFPLDGGRAGDGGGGWLFARLAHEAPDFTTEPPTPPRRFSCPHPHPTLPHRGGGLFRGVP